MNLAEGLQAELTRNITMRPVKGLSGKRRKCLYSKFGEAFVVGITIASPARLWRPAHVAVKETKNV